jgi:hypothetical protein
VSESKINVIFMRDDSHVRRYRLSPVWLRSVVYALIFLVLSAVGGGFAGLTFWRQNAALRADKAALEHDLRESAIELERLQNIDKILKSNDPEELQAMLGTMSSSADRKARKDKNPDKADDAAAPGAPPAQGEELRKAMEKVDTHQAKVENLQVRYTGSSLSLSLGLTNLRGNELLTGAAQVALVTNDGALLPLESNEADMSFSIQRFKQLSASFRLPKDLAQDKLYGFKLSLKNPSGQIIFSETHQLSRP